MIRAGFDDNRHEAEGIRIPDIEEDALASTSFTSELGAAQGHFDPKAHDPHLSSLLISLSHIYLSSYYSFSFSYLSAMKS